MKLFRWGCTLATLGLYFIGINEVTIWVMDAYPTSIIDPYFYVTAVLSLVSVVTIQEVWKPSFLKPKKPVKQDKVELETRYLYTKQAVTEGMFETAKALLRNAEETKELIKNARGKEDEQLKLILRRHERHFKATEFDAKEV